MGKCYKLVVQISSLAGLKAAARAIPDRGVISRANRTVIIITTMAIWVPAPSQARQAGRMLLRPVSSLGGAPRDY